MRIPTMVVAGAASAWVVLCLSACGGVGSGAKAPQDLVLTATSTEIAEGYSLAVRATAGGEVVKGLAWSSSDARVAVVDQNGSVRGCCPGAATIEARESKGGRRGTLTVQVVPDAAFNESVPDDPDAFWPQVERQIEVGACEVALRLDGIAAQEVRAGFRRFHRLVLPQAGDVAEEGRPEVPFYSLYFARPLDAKTHQPAAWHVEVERASPLVHTGIRPWPHQPPRYIAAEGEEDDGIPPFVQDEAFYASQDAWPSITHRAAAVQAGNVPMIEVRVVPVQYLPAAMRLDVFQETRVRVTFESQNGLVMPRPIGDYKGIKERSADSLATEIVQNRTLLEPILANDLLGSLPPMDDVFHQDEPFDLLILTRPSLYGPARQLAEWRQSQGTRVFLANLQETTYPDADSILELIRTLYDENRLEVTGGFRPHAMRALLIFGDAEHIPPWEGMNVRGAPEPTTTNPDPVYICGTDFLYSTIEGLSWIPEVALGRISVNDDVQGYDVVAKIEAYESVPAPEAPDSMSIYSYFDDVPEQRTIVPGTVTFTNGSRTVTGSGFDGQVFEDDVVRPYDDKVPSKGKWFARVSSVVSDTEIRLHDPWPEPSVTDGDGLQVGVQDGQDDWEFVKSAERVRAFILGKGIDVRFGYTRNDEPRPAPVPERGFEGGPLRWDLLGYAWECPRIEIQNNWGDGVDGIILHSDHGNPEGWGHPAFTNGDVPAIVGGPWYPILFSINCNSGYFDAEVDQVWILSGGVAQKVAPVGMWPHHTECFCEAVLRHPTGGAVAAIGGSRGTDAGKNDKLIDGLFGAIYTDYVRGIIPPSPGTRHTYDYLGDAVRAAKFTMHAWIASPTGGNSWTQADYNLQVYHLFGDPMLRIRVPRASGASD